MPDKRSGSYHLIRKAAAEFLVIVTGIVVALWVDELRDNHRMRQAEAQYLARLSFDLEGGITSLMQGIAFAEERSANGRAVFAHVMRDTVLSRSELFEAAVSVTLVPVSAQRRLGSRETYDELLTTGNLAALRDVRLREELATYYREYDRVGDRLMFWPKAFIERFSTAISPDLAAGIQVPADLDRFAGRLLTNRSSVWGEVSQLIQYQESQLSDLQSYLEATEKMLASLRGTIAEDT